MTVHNVSRDWIKDPSAQQYKYDACQALHATLDMLVLLNKSQGVTVTVMVMGHKISGL